MSPESKSKLPPTSKSKESVQCHIHDRVPSHEIDSIRKNVCVHDLPLIKHDFFTNYYCIFHLPTQGKDDELFEKIFWERMNSIKHQIAKVEKFPEDKYKDAKAKLCYDFRYVWIPSSVSFFYTDFDIAVNFSFAHFAEDADFSVSTFSEKVSFKSASFWAETNFGLTSFKKDADFSSVIFEKNVNYSESIFSSLADFNSTTFSADVNFRDASFAKSANFRNVSFANYVDFGLIEIGNVLNLEYVRFLNPEHVSFYRVRLFPSWFINADSRKIVFTDVKWKLNYKYASPDVTSELNELRKNYKEPSRLFEIACWQLASNAEENNRYEEASKFRLMANETKRLEYYKGWNIWSLHWWYWLSSRYGENWAWAAFILLLIILFVFPLIYTTRVFQVCPSDQPLAISITENKCTHRNLEILDGSAILQSLGTATFQNVEYRKPVTGWGEFWIIVEKILAPLQFALLALAIKRKFMR